MTVNENLIQYFIDACNRYSYGFVTNVENWETSDNRTRIRISGYPLEILASKVNKYWFECKMEDSIRKIFELTSESKDNQIRFEKFSESFFEDIWMACKNKEEKAQLFNLFSNHIVQEIKLVKLNKLKDNDFINKVIEEFFVGDYFSASYENTFTSCFDVFRNENFKLTSKNLKLICKGNKYALRKITNQKLLKDFVERYMPESVNDVKDCWKKIDVELASKEFVSESACRYFSFDKVQLFGMRDDKNTDFFERRLKALSTFLNKSQNQKITKIERSILDGVGEGQSHYRFFIIGENDKLNLKTMLHELVIQTIKLEDEPTIKSFQTILNYAILQQHLEIDETNQVKNNKKNKI